MGKRIDLNSSMRRISRIKYGWWVRFTLWDPKTKKVRTVLQKTFPASSYDGGYEEALFWAQAWRDKEERKNPEWRKSRHSLYPPFISKVRETSKSGVTGVHYTNYVYTQRPRYGNPRLVHVEAWNATWSENGNPRMKRFNVYTLGYAQAFEEARIHRLAMETILADERC